MWTGILTKNSTSVGILIWYSEHNWRTKYVISWYFRTKLNQISAAMYIFKSRGDGHSLLEQEMMVTSSMTSKLPFLKSKLLEWKWFGMIAAIIIIIIVICASFPSTKSNPNPSDTQKITIRPIITSTKSTTNGNDYAECSANCINGQ